MLFVRGTLSHQGQHLYQVILKNLYNATAQMGLIRTKGRMHARRHNTEPKMFLLAQMLLWAHTFIVLQFLSMCRLELRFARCNITFPSYCTNIYYPQHSVPANFVGAGHLSKSQVYKIRDMHARRHNAEPNKN